MVLVTCFTIFEMSFYIIYCFVLFSTLFYIIHFVLDGSKLFYIDVSNVIISLHLIVVLYWALDILTDWLHNVYLFPPENGILGQSKTP